MEKDRDRTGNSGTKFILFQFYQERERDMKRVRETKRELAMEEDRD